MPFRLGGRKPKRELPKIGFSRTRRLCLLLAGLIVIAGGFFRASHGMLLWTNRWSQYTYAGAQIGFGAALVLASLIPSKWLNRLGS